MNTIQPKVSCIIPFYNEEMHLAEVLDVIKNVKAIAQVICVDDGSTDNSAVLARNLFPDIQLIKLPKNFGKSGAIKQGLIIAKHEFVLLVDADLKELREREISKAINAIVRCPEIDMIILRRIRAPWYIRLFRIDTLLSGERILRTDDLKNIFNHPVTGYQLEVAINIYMLKKKKQVYWLPSSALNTFKLEKFSSWKAYSREFRMYISLVMHAGMLMLARQILFFCKEKVKDRKALMDAEIPGPVNT